MPVVRRLDLGSALVPECNPVAAPVSLAGPMNMPEEGLGDPGAEVPRAGTVIPARQGWGGGGEGGAETAGAASSE